MGNKRKPRVLLVSPYSSKIVGGIGTWSRIILDYNKGQKRCKIFFLNTVQGLPKRWSLNYKLTHFFVGILDSVLIIIRLFLCMIFIRPDVVHYTSSAASALYKDRIAIGIVRGFFNKKIVIHWHFGRIPIIFKEKGKEYERFTKVCQNADISITIDARSQESLEQSGIRSVYVPNPIPIALQVEAEKMHMGKVSVTRREGEVLFVGHILKEKGILELIQACVDCEQVKSLIVVGPFFDEQLKTELINIAKKRDAGMWLQFVGEKSREEVWNYYKTCNVFCLPSYSEGFPYVILEAMSFACPIVASKVGAIPEMLANNCGELIEAKQTEQLKFALNKVLNNQGMAMKMGEKAHTKVLDNYTIEKIFNEYFKIWNSLI